ncbi:unannotated protein [freshwater metagenome]|uniref:Unannotated protein n=1 Tax=freshwater metagenome TaxID=449393 RepID=A0A6J7UU98_9ZZZZ
MLRRPAGAYRQAATAASASSLLFTIGMMTPIAPMSSTRPMMPGSFQGTRTMGVGLLPFMACSCANTSLMSESPCCMSMHT